jgi:O-antigen/teichoic acid export membrane protein
MQKKFILNLAFLLLLNLLIKPFYILGVDAEVLKQVGEEAYGNYFALISFSFLLNIFLDAGITNFNTKNIAQHGHLLRKHFSNIIVVRLLLAIAYLLIISVLGFFIGYNSYQLWLLFVLGFNQVLVAFILYFRSNLSGLHLFVQDSIISVLDRVILILFCGILLWGNVTSQSFQIEWFIYGQTGSYLLTAVVAFALVYRKAQIFKFSWNVPFLYMILKQSAPYALLVLLMSLYYRSDSVMLERMLDNGAYHAGVYAQGFRFFEAANMIAYLFAVMLLPIFSRMLKLKQSIEGLLKLSFKLLLSGAVILGLTCWFYSVQIMEFRYDVVSEQAALSFGVLMLSFIAFCITYIFGTLLTANGSMKWLNVLAAAGMILNIILNLWFIPKYFALGSAVASFITQLLTAVFEIYLVQRVFKLTFDFRLAASFILFVFGVVAIGFLSSRISDNWIFNMSFMLLFSIIWGLITRMIAWRMVTTVLGYRQNE